MENMKETFEKDRDEILKIVRSKLSDFPPIVDRKFSRIDSKKPKDDRREFRLMTWNICASALCAPDEASKAPEMTYDWSKFRMWRTLEEILRLDCDIVCLEEVDRYEDIKPYLHSIGYTSIFCPKFNSPCLYVPNHNGPDGNAIFYRKSAFQIRNMSCEKILTNNTDDTTDIKYNKINTQVFIIAQLKHLASGNHVTVVCVHLKSKAEYHEKRWHQIEYILESVSKHVKASLGNDTDDVKKHPVIICGDFNGEPFERFYRSVVEMTELAKLRDAYSHNLTESKQPTTIKLRQSYGGMLKRAIDYVFYRVDNLELTEILDLPLSDPLINQQGLPNLTYSSDHLALACGFKFID